MNSCASTPNLAATAVALLLLADLLPALPARSHGPGIFSTTTYQGTAVYRHRRHRP
ncbi:hypothetical protein [Hymenobacter glacieicola]|uniref:hypothetical protein n=1 Tax=Hymenobacter glacieicola TaxID=1562124 RepID=UPI00166C1300|nr:hypothetical protein [Hymenobacter glacieicola]